MSLPVIIDHNNKKAVSAKDLYESLGLHRAHYAKWCKRNIVGNDFAIEGGDWVHHEGENPINIEGGRATSDYILSLDFAKRLAMMARTEHGELIRNYFIECERHAMQPKALPSPKELAQMVIVAEEEKEKAILQLNMANHTISEQAPKVEYHDKVLTSTSTFHATSVGADLGLSGVALNKKLKDARVQVKIDGHWVLTAKYKGQGYEAFRSVPYLNSKGEQCTAKEMVWTEKGRKFIIELLTMQRTG